MNVGGIDRRGDQRAFGTPMNRDVTATDLGDSERVMSRVLDTDIAVDRRDAHEVGEMGGGQKRDGIVEAGVAVDQHRGA